MDGGQGSRRPRPALGCSAIVDDDSEKTINTLCEQNTKLLNIKAGGVNIFTTRL
jgi:hypothetical protein